MLKAWGCWEQWAKSDNHAVYLGSLGEVDRDLRWTLHFCGVLCSVTAPNETPWSCGSALLICGSGCLLGERAATASTTSPSAAPSKAYCCLLTEEPHCNISPRLLLSPQVPRRSIISLLAYSRLDRMDEKLHEIEVILVFLSNIQAFAIWNGVCPSNKMSSEKSNLVLLQSTRALLRYKHANWHFELVIQSQLGLYGSKPAGKSPIFGEMYYHFELLRSDRASKCCVLQDDIYFCST